MLLMAKRATAPLPINTLLVQSLPCHRSKDHVLDKGNLSLRDCFYPSLGIQWPLHNSGHLRALSLKQKVGWGDLSGSVLCQARRCPLSTSEWETNKSQEQKRISPQNGLPYGWKRLIFTLLLKILKAQDAHVKGEDGSRKLFGLGRSLNEVKRGENGNFRIIWRTRILCGLISLGVVGVYTGISLGIITILFTKWEWSCLVHITQTSGNERLWTMVS